MVKRGFLIFFALTAAFILLTHPEFVVRLVDLVVDGAYRLAGAFSTLTVGDGGESMKTGTSG